MPRRCHCQIDPVFSQIYNLLVMKRALLYFALLLTPLSLWSQDLIVPDSADYISKCRCEKSILKYKDHDSRKYHVFYFTAKGIPGLSAGNEENAIQIVITFRVTESGANRQIVVFNTEGRTNINIT